jgi:acyl-CoA dehydrogenase
MGVRTLDTAALLFRDCRIPRDQILGARTDDTNDRHDDDKEAVKATKVGYRGVSQSLNLSRPRVSGRGIGHSLGCLDFCRERLGIEIDYARGVHRRTAIEDKMIEIEADIEAAKLSVLRATTLADDGKPNGLEAAVCKAKAGEIARTAPQRCMDLLGGLGTSREFLVEKWLRDARIIDIYEGTGQVMRLIIARELLGYTVRDLG